MSQRRDTILEHGATKDRPSRASPRVLGRSIDQSVRAGKETREHFQNMTRLIAECRELGLTPFGRTLPQPARCQSGKTSP